ncbi:NAD(P)H-hydrate dehydratase [Stappia sp. GBMRC 2046]|uniref:Bifunctional NAD(P)H-hydrate repair enzyme n=1 Tax=Stappia sediminis TaxID=2692190 RepID=A0A7X3LXM6_9HYPH|nr:NAD(P)H-hydrate dehydratase [Stappia sediminis]MXN67054.1 NAD(P)H-hydrate dehydratase [Stappia sediminis]
MEVLLTPEEMSEADQRTIRGGTPGIELMDEAGRAVADTCARMMDHVAQVLVLAGPGNNGGDGFVAARILKKRGYPVRLLLLGEASRLKGDAATARDDAANAGVPIERLNLAKLPERLKEARLVVDALFGAGLDRPLEGDAAQVVHLVNERRAKTIAVDLPSGVSGGSGAVLGEAIRATRTVTFFRRKPGHLLFPGRELCGGVSVADIGISADVLEEIRPRTFVNDRELWRPHWNPPTVTGHKYDRGHALIVSGPAVRTGAARLAAVAALRAGAGLSTVAASPSAASVHAAHLTAVMLKAYKDEEQFAAILADRRLNSVVIGPAAGVGEETRRRVAMCLDGERAVVLDADALTSFAEEPEALFASIRNKTSGGVVMTPHDGEFARLFPDIAAQASMSKPDRAREAARLSGAVIVLKGADTVIASADGRAAITENASPWLATAGSGDVLAGIVCAMMAQGLPVFEAACAGVWIHGQAAKKAGPGLISEDLLPVLKDVIAELAEDRA